MPPWSPSHPRCCCYRLPLCGSIAARPVPITTTDTSSTPTRPSSHTPSRNREKNDALRQHHNSTTTERSAEKHGEGGGWASGRAQIKRTLPDGRFELQCACALSEKPAPRPPRPRPPPVAVRFPLGNCRSMVVRFTPFTVSPAVTRNRSEESSFALAQPS